MSNKRKQKGKRLEEKVQLKLREQFNISDKKYLRRQGQSGVKQEEIGDIDIIYPEIENKFPFVIECKNQEKWKMRDLMGNSRFNKSNIFLSYIKQNQKDLGKVNYSKYGVIVFSKQYEDIYIMFYDRVDEIYEKFGWFRELINKYTLIKTYLYDINNPIYIFNFNDFIDVLKKN